MPASDIIIKGAREHNLRDVDVVLPRNQLICLTGVSGSGKSSLAFDTVFAEGQRRYIESLSSFARQFLGQMPKPDVDFIGGLSPSISISQKSTGNNPRSTVGTVTEIYDYLRVLYARVGQGHCPQCDAQITSQSREQILAQILTFPEKTKFTVLAPLIRAQKGEYRDLFEDLLKQGFVRARVNGKVVQLTDDLQLDRRLKHDIEVVVDRLVMKRDVRPRLAESVELAIKIGKGNLIIAVEQEAKPQPKPDADEAPVTRSRRRKKGSAQPGDTIFSVAYACPQCGISFDPPSPQLFSFNSPQGMCLSCDGLGELYSFDPELLIPDDTLSFKQGAIELVGKWKEIGRWRRHIYSGVAETMERRLQLAEGTLLDTPWHNLSEEHQNVWLWGTGNEHITFTWRGGNAPMKYGGQFEGVIPELLSKHRNVKSVPKRRQLENYMATMPCPDCEGERLNEQARSVRITTAHPDYEDDAAWTLPELCGLAVSDAVDFFSDVRLSSTQQLIATEALKEIRGRLQFLMNVGLDYLTLDRTAPTLSGGETQRIRLAGQIGSGLVGVLYILDEPSIGLHPRDNDRLLQTLQRLRDMGNTVLVVEHDEDTMRVADHIIDFGPGPGVRGGEIVAEGSFEQVVKAKRSVTAKYLTGKETIEIPATRRSVFDLVPVPAEATAAAPRKAGRKGKQKQVTTEDTATERRSITVRGAKHNNLQDVDVEIPLGAFVCVTGVSGSGKSSLVNDILVEALRRDLNRGDGDPGEHDAIEGLPHLDKLIAIDQTPIGRTPRSNPGTYIKVFDEIRALFTQMPEAKRRGYKPGRFSFNVKGGRCEACEGNGSNKLEMDFLADVWVTCPVCEGHRYNRETLQVRFKGYSIAEVLEMDISQLLEVFANIPKVQNKLQTLHDVGLDYLKLGQPSPTLSGGEAQRIKLARELVKKSTGKTLYLLDEPTTGLHFADIKMLLKVLHNFVEAGNTVLVVEHNLDVIKTADWIIDLGPEGGAGGGEVIAVGTPEELASNSQSHTGRALAEVLSNATSRNGQPSAKPKRSRSKRGQLSKTITVQGAAQHNLKSVDAKVQRDRMTVFCGPSGSGKSSLAMDTIYAEGQRRYVESLSSYARQFVSQMQKPAIEHIEGLSPAIAIEQKNLGHTPRSTVGTVTEIYDYLRILMARLGAPFCPDCDVPVGTQTMDEVVDKVMSLPEASRLYLMAPVDVETGQDFAALWEELQADGYHRIRVNGETHTLDQPPTLDRRRKHSVQIVVDRVVVKSSDRSRIAESIEHCLAVGRGVMEVAIARENTPESRWDTIRHSQHMACDRCGRSFDRLTPHSFSFNSHLGWCDACEGLGTQVGANPAALLRDPKLTLADGAIALWPLLDQPIARLMLEALAEATGIPLDTPFDQLGARYRRVIMHGAGDEWIEVKSAGKGKKPARVIFKFQYKGLYPALEEASRLSPTLRARLEQFVDQVDCATCSGSRLRDDAAAVRFRKRTIDEICRLPLGELQREIEGWKLTSRDRKIAGEVIREIQNRVQFLNDVGLEYLSIHRGAATLSNGEAQRIRLASQLGSGLCGVLYVLDEPTIGLHPRDNTRLLRALHKLRDLGNTLLVVEHDKEVIEGSDYICDFGPGAGRHGGQIVANGTVTQVAKRRGSVTGPYISGKKSIPVPTNRRPCSPVATPAPETTNGRRRGKRKPTATPSDASTAIALRIRGARHHNLKNIDVEIPLGAFVAITGPSGSGKSSLMEDILYAHLAKTLHRANTIPGAHDAIEGIEHINKVIRVDQTPLGNSPTSNPATYTGVFELIRSLFAQLPEAKLRGYSPRRFSFNVPGGRCEECEGAGQICIEMHFLPDVWVECETCRGQRYNPETLSVCYHGRSINDVLEMTCGDAVELFQNVPKIRRILRTLCDVGLEYLTLGQSAPTLSGGEAQRVKLAAELARPDTGRTLYLLDEPTTGLHFDDLQKLLDVMHRLVDLGNSVVVIEHNLDVIKQSDWIIDLGPEAGDAGGQVVAAGTPEAVCADFDSSGASTSHTANALTPVLEAGPHLARELFDFAAEERRQAGDQEINDIGKSAKMPWEMDGRQWHTVDRVGRKGEPCRWEGQILARVVDRIHAKSDLGATNWNARSVVEIAAKKKSDGWFFHAITGEAWLLKMKFRVARNTFNRQELERRIPLPTLNQMDEIPLYSNSPRLRLKTGRGPYQEVELRVHTLAEVDHDEFWRFIDQMTENFARKTNDTTTKLEDHMPWKKMGQKWHFLRKGFPPRKKIQWDSEVLEELHHLLCDILPDGHWLWNNQMLVNLYITGQREPWARMLTKRPESLDLVLASPKNAVAYGRANELGWDREFDSMKEDIDYIRLKFRTLADLEKGDLRGFLEQHLNAAHASLTT